MPLQKIKFQTNITVEAALKFAEGKLCDSQFGDPQYMFTTVDDHVFFVNDHGQIAPGKRADLPVVDGDSTPGYRTSATSLRSGSWVFRSIVRITAPS
jgi:cytosine/adenosine deaminase-related metal-dependent hydrolase